jgi:polyhydroxyalkanoate synthesis regulator phasin
VARTGLTKAEVKASRERLQAEGRYPSVDAVRHDLGTGSKSTIHKHLKELQEEDGQSGGIRRDATERSLNALVEQLASRLHDDADRRFRELCADHAQQLQARESELAALRSTVERLSARVEELEIEAYGALPQDGGFGDFSNLFASSRGGQRDDTAFNIVLSGGRSATIDFDSPQVQLTPRLM